MATDSGYNRIVVNTGTGTTTGTTLAGVTISTSTATGTTLGDGAAAETFSSGQPPLLTSGFTYLGLATTSGTSGFYASKSGVTYYFTKDAIAAGASVSLTADSVGAGGFDYTFCFAPGTKIATPAGERAVETLAIGDLVATADGATRPIRWIGRQAVNTLFADPLSMLPVRIQAGALAETVPSRDLLLSPGHALLLDGVLVQAGALVNGTTIRRDDSFQASFTYYHIETADHAIILAENTPAETFVDNVTRATFDNAAEYDAMFAGSPAMAALDLPRAMAARQVPQAIRQRIADRAAALAGVAVVAA